MWGKSEKLQKKERQKIVVVEKGAQLVNFFLKTKVKNFENCLKCWEMLTKGEKLLKSVKNSENISNCEKR